MPLVRIFDLIGQDIAGRRADIRSRNADGSLMYEHQEKDGPIMVTMTRVRTTEDNRYGTWLRWEWEGRGLPVGLACGSGVVMDGKKELEYYIEMEDANVTA